MASAFTLTDLSLHYSEKHLLEHVTLTVSEGDKIGIVGRNGAGKSTLLRLLAGTEEPDRGEVSRRRGLTVAYLPQTPDLNPEATITQAALDYLPAATPQEREAAAYEAQTILSRLGFTDFQQKVSTLSGGQKMRVALAGVLCRPTEALLLDEPTNHIDLDTAAWLEEQLIRYRGTLLCVTHDRYLLQRVFSRIFHVGNGGVQTYQTDYAGYLEERAQREEMAAATLRKQRSLYRTELSWIQRGARARSTKAKGRIDRFETLQENVREAPPEAKLEIKSVASRLGKKILSCEHLGCELGGRTLIRDFSYTLLRDDRVGIVGDNGAGKTTLLRLLSGDLPPTRGSVELGETVRLGVFAQHCPPMDPDARIIDAIRDVAVKVYTPDGEMSASQMAETFLFPSGMQYQKVSSLSGGEQQRVILARALAQNPPCLILDEPTNGLDPAGIQEMRNLLRHLAQRAVLRIRRDVDALFGLLGAVLALEHPAQGAGGNGGLRRGAGLRDDVDGEILALEQLAQLLPRAGGQVVACEEDLRVGILQIVVLALDQLNGSARAEVRAADADDDEHVGIRTDALCGAADALQLLRLLKRGQLQPAEKIIAGTAALGQRLVRGEDLLLRGEQIRQGQVAPDIRKINF